MLEELKKAVYEANMLLPKYNLEHLPGEMSARLTGKPDILPSNPVVLTMTN